MSRTYRQRYTRPRTERQMFRRFVRNNWFIQNSYTVRRLWRLLQSEPTESAGSSSRAA